MTGRGLAVVAGLSADLQPAGWRLTDASGVDHRRARSLLAQDLDLVEELGQDYTGAFKTQVAGPWTLAATVEKPRGDKVLSDHGARRELAQALAEGLTVHLADLRRRLPRGGSLDRAGRRACARRRRQRPGPDRERLRPAPPGRPARGLRPPGVGRGRDHRRGRRGVGALLRPADPVVARGRDGRARAVRRPRPAVGGGPRHLCRGAGGGPHGRARRRAVHRSGR